jgi:hypothetical protein
VHESRKSGYFTAEDAAERRARAGAVPENLLHSISATIQFVSAAPHLHAAEREERERKRGEREGESKR